MPAQPPIYGGILYQGSSYIHVAGAGVGEVNMLRLPPGRIQLFPSLSRVISTAMVATADIHVGNRAYTNLAGVTVVEDNNSLLDDGNAAAALDVALDITLVADYTEWNSRAGIGIYFEIDTANIEDTDIVSLWMAYRFVESTISE